MRSLYGLAMIVVVAWLLIIGESYIFFAVIRPLGPALHVGLRYKFLSSLLKILGTLGLAVGWVAVMLALRDALVRAKFPRKTPSASS